MELLPNFQIGLFNTYLASLIFMILPRIMVKVMGKDFKRAFTLPKMNIYEKIIYNFWVGVFIFSLLLTIFIPFVYGTLFWIGFILSCIALISSLSGIYTYMSTQKNELVISGIYKISRNVDYFTSTLYLLGIALMANSILLLCLSLLFFILYQITSRYEERMCEEIYKNEFIEYKKNTAKNFYFF